MLLTAGVAYAICPAGSTCSSFDSFLNGLSAATTPTGTELVPCYQGSTTAKCTTAQVANLAAASGDVIASAGVAIIQAGAVTLAKQSNFGASSLRGNATTSAATGQDLNPLAAANLMSAVLSVEVATTANVTLSGTQTVDTIALTQGQSVAVWQQTTTSQNGIYIVQSGAWTRAINFPSGYVIAQNCDLSVFVKRGTTYGGSTLRLSTESGSITIGTTAQIWSKVPLAAATNSVAGGVTISSVIDGGLAAAFGTPATHNFDCVDFNVAGSPTAGNPVTVGADGNAAGTAGTALFPMPMATLS